MEIRRKQRHFKEDETLGSPLLVDHSFSRSSKHHWTQLQSWYCDWKEPNHPKLHYTRTITYTISPDLCSMVEFPPKRKLRRMHSYRRQRSQTTNALTCNMCHFLFQTRGPHSEVHFPQTGRLICTPPPMKSASVRKSVAGGPKTP